MFPPSAINVDATAVGMLCIWSALASPLEDPVLFVWSGVWVEGVDVETACE